MTSTALSLIKGRFWYSIPFHIIHAIGILLLINVLLLSFLSLSLFSLFIMAHFIPSSSLLLAPLSSPSSICSTTLHSTHPVLRMPFQSFSFTSSSFHNIYITLLYTVSFHVHEFDPFTSFHHLLMSLTMYLPISPLSHLSFLFLSCSLSSVYLLPLLFFLLYTRFLNFFLCAFLLLRLSLYTFLFLSSFVFFTFLSSSFSHSFDVFMIPHSSSFSSSPLRFSMSLLPRFLIPSLFSSLFSRVAYLPSSIFLPASLSKLNTCLHPTIPFFLPLSLFVIAAVLARVPGAPDGLRNNQTNGTSEAFTDASTYASIEGHLPLNGRVVQSAPFQPLKEIAHDLIHQVWNGNALKDAVVALQWGSFIAFLLLFRKKLTSSYLQSHPLCWLSYRWPRWVCSQALAALWYRVVLNACCSCLLHFIPPLSWFSLFSVCCFLSLSSSPCPPSHVSAL